MPNQEIQNTAEIVSVPRWLVLGPFPSSTAALNLKDAVRNEAFLRPVPGQINAGRIWQVWAGNPVNFLEPQLGFAQTEACFAYAFTYVHVPAAERVELMAGSDDGIAIWVNGNTVHFNDVLRIMAVDQDIVPATLKPGWNALLVKISQDKGEWVFSLRIRRKIPGGRIKFTLNRTITGLKAGAGRSVGALALAPLFEKSRLVGTPRGWALQMKFRLCNYSFKRADRLNVAVVDVSGRLCGRVSLPSLKPLESLESTIALPADKLFRALAENGKARLCANSILGSADMDIGLESMPALFVNALVGIDLPLPDRCFIVPKCFRGQPAILEVQSQRGMLNRLAAQSQRVWRAIPARETASGRVDLKLNVPPAITDPVKRLAFGEPSLRDLAQRAQCLIMDLRAGSAAADQKAVQGLRALAEGDFSVVVKAMQAVYQALARSLPDRSRQRITLVGHAHIDMNWLWDTAETKKVVHDTFRQVLVFMKEFPQFTFSQSQASTYQFIERLDPEMFAQIRRYVKAGRWELLGGMVDEGDTNLSSGEALARTMLIGQRYFLSRFGRLAKVGWLPDNFGHIGQLPQILRLAGMSAFYAQRCQPRQGFYIWEGVDGTRVINYSTQTYNGEVTSHLHLVPEMYDPGRQRLLWVYGVGDHGGGPTRHDITRAVFYNTVPGFPKIQFGTATQFFESSQDNLKDYPVYCGERQYIHEGCYTSVARIKAGNRRCENMLYVAEVLNALMACYGHAYPGQLLSEAWHTVTFNQFHDILCGSAVHESNEASIAAYHVALDKAEEARYSALRFLAANVPTDSDRGQPLVVFNPCPWRRTDIVEAELFSYYAPATARLNEWGDCFMGPPAAGLKAKRITPPLDIGRGPLATLAMTDQKGHPVDAQIVAGKRFPNGWRMKVRFLSKNVPACGWRVFYARPAEPGASTNFALKIKGTTIETPWLEVKVDSRTGHVTRIYDKRRRKEVLARGAKGNALKIYMEKPHGMSAWCLGPVSKVHTLDKAEHIRVTEHGPVRAVIEVWRRWNRSFFIQRIQVYRDLPRVEFEIEAHWFEQGGPAVDAPMLRVAFPVNIKKGRFFCDTPFAAVERPVDGREVPAQKWVDLSNTAGGAALLNDSKYGHRCNGNVLEITLLRASYEPDPYPDQGHHFIRYAILPHAGDWRKAFIPQEGMAFNAPLPAIETPPNQKGRLPEAGELLSLAPDNIQLSGVKRAEDDDALIVRFYETSGKATRAKLTWPQPVRSAQRVNLLEQPLPGVVREEVDGRTVCVAVRAHEIVTLKVRIGA